MSQQTFKDIELVYVDAHYEENKEQFSQLVKPFSVIHVPIHHNHRYWYDRGNFFIAAAKNTGIIHSKGELLITIDDAEFLPRHLLQLAWDYYKSGKRLVCLHKRLKSIENLDELKGSEYVNDHRWRGLSSPRTCSGEWAFAGTSFSIEDALALNGFNEKMDGYKSLDDCEFGTRLSKLHQLVVDPKGFLYILDHPHYTNKSDGSISIFMAVENHGLLSVAKSSPDLKANVRKVSENEMKVIQRDTIKYRKFDPLTKDNLAKLEIWRNTPNFDLKEDRELLK